MRRRSPGRAGTSTGPQRAFLRRLLNEAFSHLCGRAVSDAATLEPDNNDLDPDCRVCWRAARRLRAQSGRA